MWFWVITYSMYVTGQYTSSYYQGRSDSRLRASGSELEEAQSGCSSGERIIGGQNAGLTPYIGKNWKIYVGVKFY